MAYIHGDSHKDEYLIWVKIKHRCRNPLYAGYADYGGRGIGMCDEWYDSFSSFYAALGPRPSKGHSVDRENNLLDYTPENCAWATRAKQNRNKRSTRNYTYKGKTQCIVDWATEYGVKRETLTYRLNHGWTLAAALTYPLR